MNCGNYAASGDENRHTVSASHPNRLLGVIGPKPIAFGGQFLGVIDLIAVDLLEGERLFQPQLLGTLRWGIGPEPGEKTV
jgi:hypothetical protein